MVRQAIKILMLATVASQVLPAGQFQFGTMVRAGIAGAQDWELAAGNSSGSLPPNARTQHVNPHYTNGRVNPFEISYTRSTNLVTLTVRTGPGASTVSFNPAGGTSLIPAIWRIPANSFYVSATRIPFATSISLTNLRLSGGISVLQPIQQTTMTAAQSNTPGGALVRQSGDIVFRITGSGDWQLLGEVTMTGVAPNGTQPGAKRSELQFGFNAIGESPEPGTILGTAIGLGALLWGRRRKGTKASEIESSGIEAPRNQGAQS